MLELLHQPTNLMINKKKKMKIKKVGVLLYHSNCIDDQNDMVKKQKNLLGENKYYIERKSKKKKKATHKIK